MPRDHAAAVNRAAAGQSAADLGLLKEPVQENTGRRKQIDLLAEANQMKHEFRRLPRALNRLETHFAGIA